MKRYLKKYIQEDLDQKVILLTGPRQTGKTTFKRWLTLLEQADRGRHG